MMSNTTENTTSTDTTTGTTTTSASPTKLSLAEKLKQLFGQRKAQLTTQEQQLATVPPTIITNIQNNRPLIRKLQEIKNAIYAGSLINAELIAETLSQGQGLTPVSGNGTLPVPLGPSTQIIDLVSYATSQRVTVLNHRNTSGSLDGLTIIANSGNFIVYIAVDNDIIMNHSYSQLTNLSGRASDIAAFVDGNNNYVVNIVTKAWSESIFIQLIVTSGTVTFSNIYATYNEQ